MAVEASSLDAELSFRYERVGVGDGELAFRCERVKSCEQESKARI